jgi:hypothetical protein
MVLLPFLIGVRSHVDLNDCQMMRMMDLERRRAKLLVRFLMLHHRTRFSAMTG